MNFKYDSIFRDYVGHILHHTEYGQDFKITAVTGNVAYLLFRDPLPTFTMTGSRVRAISGKELYKDIVSGRIVFNSLCAKVEPINDELLDLRSASDRSRK